MECQLLARRAFRDKKSANSLSLFEGTITVPIIFIREANLD